MTHDLKGVSDYFTNSFFFLDQILFKKKKKRKKTASRFKKKKKKKKKKAFQMFSLDLCCSLSSLHRGGVETRGVGTSDGEA